MEEKELNILDVLSVIVRRRWLLVVNFLIVAIVSVIYSLLLPKWYTGTASVIPPTQSVSPLSAVTSGSLGNIVEGITGIGGENIGLYLAILDSRTMKKSVLDAFALVRLYGFKDKYYIEDVYKELAQRVSINFDDDQGIINVSVLDKNPRLAAQIANYFVQQLDIINKQLSVEKARRERIFLEQRVEMNYRDIEKAEKALKEFQQAHNAISIPDQMTAAIKTAAELKAQLIALQVQYEVLSANVSPEHPSLKDLKNQIRQLKEKLVEFNSASREFGEGGGIFPGFAEVPDLMYQYTDLYREVEIQNTLLEFLLPQYEAAKIQEAKDTPTIQVLDYAVPAEKKTKPKRAKIVIFACLFCTLITIIFIFVEDYFRNLKQRSYNDFKSWNKITDFILEDLRRLPVVKYLFYRKS